MMKKPKTKCLLKSVSLFISLLFIVSCLFSFVSSAENLDFSRPGFSDKAYNETVSAADLIEDIFSLTLSEAERNYLTEYGDFKLTYPKNIPSSYVELTALENQLLVSAKEYSYSLADGTRVSFLPASLKTADSLADKVLFPAADSEGNYILSLPFDVNNADFKIYVDYELSVDVAAQTLNSALSKAYSDAEYFAYLSELSEYDRAMKKYEAYLSEKKAYDILYAEYLLYLDELADYGEAKLLYDKYLADMEKYNADYLLYLESQKKAESLADEIAAYNAYVQEMEKIEYRIGLIADTKLEVGSLERSLYWAINGGAVTTLLENRDALTGDVVGADEELLDMAESATKILRPALKNFFSKTNDEERYSYYKLNYTRLNMNFTKLFKALDELYQNKNVRIVLDSYDKSEKFELLLAQLYFAVNAFSDEPVYDYDGDVLYDSNYKIQTGNVYKTPAEIIGDPSYYVDRNIAAPAKDDVFPDEVPKPDYTPFPEPEKPDEVKEPALPEKVDEPKAPDVVTEPEKPQAVQNPGIENARYPFAENSLEDKLLKEFLSGGLSKRENLYASEQAVLKLSVTLEKSLNADEVTVTYHDKEFDDPEAQEVNSFQVESGTFASIDYVPQKAETEKEFYVFVGWADENGELVNLSSVTEDVRLYPKYRTEKKKCKVTWIIGSESFTESFPYDEIPVCSFVPEKTSELLNVYYEFTSWSPAPVAVQGNASYVAQFEKKYTVPELESDSAITLTEDTLNVTCSQASLRLDISRLLDIASGHYAVSFKLGDDELFISFAELIKLKNADAHFIEILLGEISAGYSVNFYDVNSVALVESYKMNAKIKTSNDSQSARLFYVENGEKQYVRFNSNNGKIEFNLNTGRLYSYVSESSISIFSQSGITITLGKNTASPGESVSVEYLLPAGSELVELYYVGHDGNKVKIENGSFVMPDFSVTVGAEFKKIEYTVKFMSEETLISSSRYHLGDVVKIPENLWRADDDEYSYTFVGWTPEITEVTGDVVYYAVFEKTPIVKNEPDGLRISEGVLKIIVTAVLLLSLFVFGALPAAIITLVLFVKRRKMRLPRANKLKNH